MTHYPKSERNKTTIKNSGQNTLTFRDTDDVLHILLPGDLLTVQMPKGYQLRLVRIGEVK